MQRLYKIERMDSATPETPAATPSTVLVYSSHAKFLQRVQFALGSYPAPGVELAFEEFSTHAELQRRIDYSNEFGDVALCILDGEAAPTGGLGISRQFKNERDDCPAMLVIVARKDDTFLAGWSQADAVLHQPIDPAALAETVVSLINRRVEFPPPPRNRTLLQKIGLSR